MRVMILQRMVNKNFTAHGIVPGFLWGFVYVSSPPEGATSKGHINIVLPPTQSLDNPPHLFMFMCFSFPDFRRVLSGSVRDTPSYRAIPFRDSIAEGGIAPICLVSLGIAQVSLRYPF